MMISCKAQSPIINITDYHGSDIPAGSYFKDTYNDLDPFVGTYVFEEGNIYFKVILKKIVMTYNQSYYEDMIVGEMQYRVNGVDLFNSLSKINIVYPNQEALHSIDGNYVLLNHNKPECYDCAPNEKRLSLFFSDGRSSGDVIIQRITVGGNPAIKFEPRTRFPTRSVGSPVITKIVPDREFIMIKQP